MCLRGSEGYDSPRDVMYDAFFSSTLIMADTWSVVNFTINGREDLKGIHITSILGSVCRER